MTNFIPTTEDHLGERYLQPGAIALAPELIHWATTQSQALTSDPLDLWSAYIQLLAFAGVHTWLQEQAPDLDVFAQNAVGEWRSLANLPLSLGERSLEASSPEGLAEISRLRIGQTLVHLLSLDCIEDGSVDVPSSVVETTHSFSQLDLLVEVLEELALVQVRGFLPQPDLVQSIQTAGLSLDIDQTYTVPVDWFHLNPHQFLLEVTRLSQIPATPSLFAANLDLNPQRIGEALARPAINAAVWVQGELDQVAEAMAATLLPPFSYSSALRSLRSPVVQLDGIVSDLTRYRGVTIPDTAKSMAYDFQLADVPLRLYEVVWEMPTAGDTPDWMLLVVLSPQPDTLLPLGSGLQIRDHQTLLSETVLNDASSTFLYSQVVGAQDESFLVTVRSPEGNSLSMPPLTFRLGGTEGE